VTTRQPWFERAFPSGLPAHLLPVIVERLRGTPARLVDRLSAIPPDILTRRSGDSWSIQENVGHLLDLEPLWHLRVDDLRAGRAELTVADLDNRRTHEANHNAVSPEALLREFRRARASLVLRLETFPDDATRYTATHPRLKMQMNVIDTAFFVAEHDDYHLARMSELLRAFLPGSSGF
jgi:uncharacterized damage-inducible protein DinB